jgi:hypothetical protein
MKQNAVLIVTSEDISYQGASGPGWVRLYQVADCYLDLSYELAGQKGLLTGQLLCEGRPPFKSAVITLVGPEGTPLQSAKVLPKKGFRMFVRDLSAHRLELTLDQNTYTLASFQ